MGLTREEKLKLIRNLETLKIRQLNALRKESSKIALKCEGDVARRLKRVSMTLRKIKLGQVLDLERERGPTVAELRRRYGKRVE